MYYEAIDIINIFKTIKGQKTVKSLPKLKHIEEIQILTDRFNTKWSNINPYDYFKCGLKLWKTFSYSKFLNESIINEYIKQDKRKKRKDVQKEDIERSFSYLKYIGVKSLNDTKNYTDAIIFEYLNNNIDKVLLSYLLFNKYMPSDDISRRYASHIFNNKSEMEAYVKRYSRYIKKLGESL